jgi:hypothetical protein
MRYGTFKYGTGIKYGLSTDKNLGWGVMVDWAGTGTPTGSESIYMTGFNSFRGRRSFLEASGGGFSPMETGKVRISLQNDDSRYDGWNAASPLYPNVIYGKDIWVYVVDSVTGTRYPIFKGIVSDIESNSFGDNPQAIISADDGWRWLRDYPARVNLRTAIAPDAALGLILDAVGWPVRWGRSLMASTDSIPFWWSSGSKNAGQEIDDLVQSYLGYFFIDASGVATFVTRQSNTAAVVDFTQETTLKDVQLSQPWAYSRNITRIKTHPRTAAATGVIWEMSGTPPSIAAGGSLTIFADYSYGGSPTPAQNVLAPVATTDYLLNSAAGGGGTNLTASLTVTLTDFGDTAKIVYANGSASIGYLIKAQVRGDAIYERDASDVTYPVDTTTVTMPREFVLDLAWQQDLNIAVDFTNTIGAYLARQNAFPVIKVEANPTLQFAPDLFDIVTLRLERLGINSVSFRIGGIEHRTTGETCQNVLTCFYLEPFISGGVFWTWPIVNYGVDTIFGW